MRSRKKQGKAQKQILEWAFSFRDPQRDRREGELRVSVKTDSTQS